MGEGVQAACVLLLYITHEHMHNKVGCSSTRWLRYGEMESEGMEATGKRKMAAVKYASDNSI